jgi:hypothetical protein
MPLFNFLSRGGAKKSQKANEVLSDEILQDVVAVTNTSPTEVLEECTCGARKEMIEMTWDIQFPHDARTQWKRERFSRKSCWCTKGLQEVRIRKNGNLSLEGEEESVLIVLNAILVHLISFQPAAGLSNDVED